MAQPSFPSSPDTVVQNVVGYHDVDNMKAREILQLHLSTNGHYLLRPSSDRKGGIICTICVTNNNKIWNYRLARDPFSSQYYIFSHTMFPNIQLLLAYYKHTPINADINTLLLHPIARQQKITPQQKFEEDEEIYGDVDQYGLSDAVDDSQLRIPGFHRSLPKRELNTVMNSYLTTDGWYLLRPSSTVEGQLTLAVTFKGQVLNFKITKDCNQFYIAPKRRFDSIRGLLEYYKTSPIRSKKYDKQKIFVLYPIPVEENKRTGEPHSVGNGRQHYTKSPSGKTAPPAPPPPKPWLQIYDEKYKRLYYYNAQTRQSMWERPLPLDETGRPPPLPPREDPRHVGGRSLPPLPPKEEPSKAVQTSYAPPRAPPLPPRPRPLPPIPTKDPLLATDVPTGHILTKQELRVLDTILAVYSDEKIKEILLTIQRKHDSVSLEEVTRLLHECGQALVADGLEESMKKGVESAKHYEAYEKALRDGLKLTILYLKFLFFGPPRSGKSSMRRRLVQEILNLLTLGQKSASTGIAEAHDVMVKMKKLTSETALIASSEWRSLKGSTDKNGDGDISSVARFLYRLISDSTTTSSDDKPVQHAAEPVQHAAEPVQHAAEDDYVDEADISALEDDTTDSPAITSPPQSPQSDSKVVKREHSPDVLENPTASSLSDSQEEEEVKAAFEKLKLILQSGSLEELHLLLETLVLINMMDVGGQPDFLDMLPALTIGPALYMLFFRLDQDLKKRYVVHYLEANNDCDIELDDSYCIEHVLHQSLASIACFSHSRLVQSASSDDPLNNAKSRDQAASSCAILLGTYKDQVKDEEIIKKENEIEEMYFKTKLHKEGLLLKTKEGKPFFTVDNMEGTEESEMSSIRADIEQIVTSYFKPIPIPASWLMFRILLQQLDKPIIKLSQCEKIAKHLSMLTSLHEALWFFHNNIGSILYYPDIPSVRGIVIANPQVIFDSITTIIVKKFRSKNRTLKPGEVDNFHLRGLFSLSQIEEETEEQRSDLLTPKQLVDVLEHLNLLAEVKQDEEESTSTTSGQSSETKFIIPAVLDYASKEALEPSRLCKAPPLLIHFEGGFVPFGVFSASIARLIARQDALSPKWRLSNEKVMKNKVKFSIDKAFFATLISRPQYIEVQIECHPRARSKLSLAHICSTVRQIVVETLETVINKMRFKPHLGTDNPWLSDNFNPLTLAFVCCLDDSHSDHFMKVIKDEGVYCAECPEDEIELNLDDEHNVWFKQDETSNGATPTLGACSTSVPSSSVYSDEVQNHHLSRMEWKEGDTTKVVKVYEESAHQWIRIGQNLGLESYTLTNIRDNFAENYGRVTQVFQKWLENAVCLPNSRDYPRTWRGLVNLLRNSELGTLANKVDRALTAT